jgi:multimeric flavodoxin WrbA
MNVIAVCGSPRKGNTEWMLQKLLDDLGRGGIEVELILLRKRNIKRCLGCLTCEAGGKEREGACAVSDDMQEIYPKMLAADVIILGTPVYFYMLSGLLKNFLDRTCPVWTRLEGKKAAGVAVAEEAIGQTIKDLKNYAVCCGMAWVGSVTALAKTPGEVAHVQGIESKLRRLSAKILASTNREGG